MAIFCAGAAPEIVNLLLGAGADPNHADHEAYGPCWRSVRSAGRLVSGRSWRRGADPNARHGGRRQSTLGGRAPRRLAPPVRWLLEAGATPNDGLPEYDSLDNQLIKGTTPLMYAAATDGRRSAACCWTGADPALTNDRGQTHSRCCPPTTSPRWRTC